MLPSINIVSNTVSHKQTALELPLSRGTKRKRKRDLHNDTDSEEITSLIKTKIHKAEHDTDVKEQEHPRKDLINLDEKPSRECRTCHETKDLEAFTCYNGNYRLQCNSCKQALRKAKAAERREKPLTALEKTCIVCMETKSTTEFLKYAYTEDGFMNCCALCHYTPDTLFRQMVCAAKRHANRRNKVDMKRQDGKTRGTFTLTKHDVKEMWETQNGRCGISGLPMKLAVKQRDMVSIERIDMNKGYTRENCMLICLMFNATKQITREKLFYILFHHEQPMTDAEMDQLPLDLMTKRLLRTNSTSKSRHALSSKIIIDLFKAQKGCCAYSGLRLRIHAGSPNFHISLERVNRNQGYTRENIILIIQELNIGAFCDNITRECIDEVREKATFPENIPSIDELEHYFQQQQTEFEQSALAFQDSMTCNVCNNTKPIKSFTNHGYVAPTCRACR